MKNRFLNALLSDLTENDNLSDEQWQEACRREAVIRPLAEQDAVSRQATVALEKRKRSTAVASETGRPGFLKTL
jgi:hypothetical protein